ncbi:hypothetical protein VNO77_15957 [Canavalia gladiata]|uniref:Uncharacterized protein n=1 Tax=Canavalia gladiata TaxID=3824 RepID=A0AAN9M3A2_CANGL
MSSSVKGSEEYREVSQDLGMEEEEDLFEIDLEAVNCIQSSPHCWESYYTSTGNIALLANCLLPISDVSSAVPAGKTNFLFITEPISLGEYLRLPFLAAQFHFQFPK